MLSEQQIDEIFNQLPTDGLDNQFRRFLFVALEIIRSAINEEPLIDTRESLPYFGQGNVRDCLKAIEMTYFADEEFGDSASDRMLRLAEILDKFFISGHKILPEDES
jgi:hypothetical protein